MPRVFKHYFCGKQSLKPAFTQKIKLTNAGDKAVAARGFIKETEIRQIEADFLVDTGAFMLCINEEIQHQLQLDEVGEEIAELADGSSIALKVVGPVEIKIHTRKSNVDALVLPRNSQPLLGSIPLENMDLLVDPRLGQLILPPDRPYLARTIVK